MEDFSKIAPLLSKIKKDNPFSVPDGYFSELTIVTEEKNSQSKKQNTKIRFLHSARPFVAIAASIILIFSVWLIFSPKSSVKTQNSVIAIDTMNEMAEMNLYKINDRELMQIISDEEIKENVNVTLDSDAIIEYLSDQKLDIKEIFNFFNVKFLITKIFYNGIRI
jgi:hypothetical protein